MREREREGKEKRDNNGLSRPERAKVEASCYINAMQAPVSAVAVRRGIFCLFMFLDCERMILIFRQPKTICGLGGNRRAGEIYRLQ